MSVKFFITGTDTEIGKTYISVGLLNAFKQKGYSTIGLKPIASGACRVNGELQNRDACLLQQAASIDLPYHWVNPFVFEAAIAPHLAAAAENQLISSKNVITQCEYALRQDCDVHVVEGVGGWAVPLNQCETLLTFVKHYQMRVILVVGMRLGCMNHAVLTYRAMLQDNVPIAGWVANCFDKLHDHDEVIATLQQWLKIPFLGRVSFNQKPEEILQIEKLLSSF